MIITIGISFSMFVKLFLASPNGDKLCKKTFIFFCISKLTDRINYEIFIIKNVK